MRVAFDLMTAHGFSITETEERPAALQRLAAGELQCRGPRGELVELHWSPFPGWWFRRAAAVDTTALWQRIEPFVLPPPGNGEATATSDPALPLYRLAAEDMFIHLATHLAINHRFSKNGLRGLLDMALLHHACPLDVDVIVARAQRWRLATVLWLTLQQLGPLFALERLSDRVASLQPGALRQAWLQRLVSPAALLAGRELRRGANRFLLLLLLVDRPRDMVRLAGRTLWPERAWLEARYGAPTSIGQHLWRLLRSRRV
jgi:hypothetical protein